MNTYSVVLAFHVISIATWMIMLVYLPKLFVYHITATRDAQALIVIQESSLYKVGTIAMIYRSRLDSSYSTSILTCLKVEGGCILSLRWRHVWSFIILHVRNLSRNLPKRASLKTCYFSGCFE